jgi:hypothetical protein
VKNPILTAELLNRWRPVCLSRHDDSPVPHGIVGDIANNSILDTPRNRRPGKKKTLGILGFS